jgi:hypothetical protein
MSFSSRTRKCHHIFCNDCAVKAFGASSSCPYCGSRLTEGDVVELMVGVNGMSIEDAIYSYALKFNSWNAILDSIERIEATVSTLMGM